MCSSLLFFFPEVDFLLKHYVLPLTIKSSENISLNFHIGLHGEWRSLYLPQHLSGKDVIKPQVAKAKRPEIIVIFRLISPMQSSD